ncbi:HAMP domain-containing sensor histidine kinase [Marinitoga arctica]
MKNSIRNEILLLNISFQVFFIIIIFIITLYSFQKSIFNNLIEKMTTYSQESQIMIMKELNGKKYSEVFDILKRIAPFYSELISKKYDVDVEIYDIQKKLLNNNLSNKKYFIYLDLHYAINGMKNYIFKKDENNILFFTSPIFFNNETIGAIRFIYNMKEEMNLYNNIKISLFFLGILSIIILTILNYIFSTSLIRPIKTLINESEKVSQGNFNVRIELESNYEINSLVNSFNKMIDKIEHYIESLKKEKQKQKNFIDNMTHEFKTPITSILGHAELIPKLKNEKDRAISINYIISEGNRLLNLVEELLYVSKLNKNSFVFDFKIYNIKTIINECLNIMNPKFKKYSIKIYTNILDKKILLDFEKIKEVILNILDNAIKHSQCDTIKIYSYSKNNMYFLIIEDNGIGISNIENLFNPFMTKKKGKSFGIGLCVSKEIIKKHNGEIHIDSELNTGTRVYISIPEKE